MEKYFGEINPVYLVLLAIAVVQMFKDSCPTWSKFKLRAIGLIVNLILFLPYQIFNAYDADKLYIYTFYEGFVFAVAGLAVEGLLYEGVNKLGTRLGVSVLPSRTQILERQEIKNA